MKTVLEILIALPAATGTAAFLFLVLSPESNVGIWYARVCSIKLIGCSFAAQAFLVPCLLCCRRWRKLVLSFCSAVFLLVILLLSTILGGPDIESVKNAISKAIAVPPQVLKCIGGVHRRESVIFFELDGCVVPDLSRSRKTTNLELLKQTARALEANQVTISGRWEIQKMSLGLDSLIIVMNRERCVIVFWGNAVL